MEFKIKGKVHEVSATTQVTDSLKKRELIVEYAENPQYPEFIKFEAAQDKCALLDPLGIGDEVEVFFNLRGRPWTDKTGKKSYFNSLQLWRIIINGGGKVSEKAKEVVVEPEESDLPF